MEEIGNLEGRNRFITASTFTDVGAASAMAIVKTVSSDAKLAREERRIVRRFTRF